LAACSASIGPAPGRPDSAATVLTPLLGVAGILAALYAAALLLAAVGLQPPGLMRALDPAQSGSLPELWAAFELGLAALLPLAAIAAGRGRSGGLLPLAALPLTLLAVETTDLAARLVPLLATALPVGLVEAGWGDGGAKLLAWLLIGTAAGAPVLLMATDPRHSSRATGRHLLAWLLLAGGASVALDLVRGLAALEELVELLLYTGVAGIVLDHLLRSDSSKI
jgi:hypothetical protein